MQTECEYDMTSNMNNELSCDFKHFLSSGAFICSQDVINFWSVQSLDVLMKIVSYKNDSGKLTLSVTDGPTNIASYTVACT